MVFVSEVSSYTTTTSTTSSTSKKKLRRGKANFINNGNILLQLPQTTRWILLGIMGFFLLISVFLVVQLQQESSSLMEQQEDLIYHQQQHRRHGKKKHRHLHTQEEEALANVMEELYEKDEGKQKRRHHHNNEQEEEEEEEEDEEEERLRQELEEYYQRKERKRRKKRRAREEQEEQEETRNNKNLLERAMISFGRHVNKQNNENNDDQGNEVLQMLQKNLQQVQSERQANGELSLREQFELKHSPHDKQRIQKVVKAVRELDRINYSFNTTPSHTEIMTYNTYDCPYDPPLNYPMQWNVLDVLRNWNPDDMNVPPQIYNGFCIFDWNLPQDMEKSLHYRELELPFIIHNHPQVLQTVERWNTPNYIDELVGDEPTKCEFSHNNHLMYWKLPGEKKHKKNKHTPFADAQQYQQQHHKTPPEGWEPPTENLEITYAEWYQKARHLQTIMETSDEAADKNQAEHDHWYFRLNGAPNSNQYLYEELEYFNPLNNDVEDEINKDNIIPGFMQVDTADHRGINCRFGMMGNMAEAHYDFSRNFIILFGGLRRYILAHPNQCINMELYPPGHPSARHSSINWSTFLRDMTSEDKGRPFTKAQVNEIVLQAGDVLYLPTGWFHFIVSLNINYQCNSRSGITYENDQTFHDCGFGQ